MEYAGHIMSKGFIGLTWEFSEREREREREFQRITFSQIKDFPKEKSSLIKLTLKSKSNNLRYSTAKKSLVGNRRGASFGKFLHAETT